MAPSAASSASRSDSSGARTVTAAFGLEQQRHAPFGHDAAADDEDGAIREIREQR